MRGKSNTVFREAVEKVRGAFPAARPSCAIILGSGWGDIVKAFTMKQSVSYEEIPSLGSTRVKGHSGRLILAESNGLEILVFQGRHHWYENDDWTPIALPVYLSAELGVSVLVLTNAAGGIRNDFQPGDLMVIDDHINAMGVNALVGERDPASCSRFPDQTEIYDPRLRELLDRAARLIGEDLRHGIYIATTGPAYETPAEISAFKTLGGDAVGMSTVPEAMLANSVGLRVAGISCITNRAACRGGSRLAHDDIVKATQKMQPVMRKLLNQFFKELAQSVFNTA